MTSPIIFNNELQAPFLPQMRGKVIYLSDILTFDIVIPRPPLLFEPYYAILDLNGFREQWEVYYQTFPRTLSTILQNLIPSVPIVISYDLVNLDGVILRSPPVTATWEY